MVHTRIYDTDGELWYIQKYLDTDGGLFSVESITSQDDEVFLTNIIITQSIIIDSIKELSSNSAAGPDVIPASLLLNFSLTHLSKKLKLSPFLSQVIEQFPVTIVLFL